MRTYLIHRGDWPVPQGLHRQACLVPPASLLHVDTRWEIVTLSPRDEERKRAAIQCYRSQTAVMRRFLTASSGRTSCSDGCRKSGWRRKPPPVLTVGGLPSD